MIFSEAFAPVVISLAQSLLAAFELARTSRPSSRPLSAFRRH
jgi:hypothetical protein